MSKKKVFHELTRLDFVQKDFMIVVANTINEGIDFLKHEYEELSDLEEEQYDTSQAVTISRRSYGSVTVFKHSQLQANYICHEVCHVTHALFKYAGIPLDDSSDEAYCYHNDMLFRTVVEFCKNNKLKIQL